MPHDLYDMLSVTAWITQNAKTRIPYSAGFSIARAFRQPVQTPQEQQQTVPELFWPAITLNEHGDWINRRSAGCDQLFPLHGDGGIFNRNIPGIEPDTTPGAATLPGNKPFTTT